MPSPEWIEFQGGEIMVLDCAIVMIERIHHGPWAGAFKLRFGLKQGEKNYWHLPEARRDAIELAKLSLRECLFQLETIRTDESSRQN
jgi:hypothetical protein